MMITDGGIIIQLRVQEISNLGRITSGVKMINLDQGVKVAKIAKVRGKISNGEQEFEDVDDALEDIPEEYVSREISREELSVEETAEEASAENDPEN